MMERVKNEEPITFCVVSLGCSKNLVDTEVMCGALASAGFAITNVAEIADVMIVNTCCFIADARTESHEAIEEAVEWKVGEGGGIGRRVVVAGCWPQRDVDFLTGEFPDVDVFCGFDAVERLPALLTPFFSSSSCLQSGTALASQVDVSQDADYLYSHETPRLLLTSPSFSYVKIADGCDNCCSYCAIPLIRGGFRSRPMDSILTEAEGLLASGVCELNLVAQDTTNYGRDLGGDASLPTLLDRFERMDGDFWVRVLYSHPRHLSGAVLDRLTAGGHVLPYVDLPLQHISGAILGRMGRGLGEDETRRLLTRMKSDYPQLAVRTTFLVGFPGETDDDFAKLERLVAEYEFEHVGVFMYSREPGTGASSSVEPAVERAVMEARRGRLMELQQGIVLTRNRARVGGEFRVVVEGVASEFEGGSEGRMYWRGRTMTQAPDVDDCVFFTGREEGVGDGFVDIVVEDAGAYELWGCELEKPGVTG